jgi:hypothetical protein
MTSTTANVKVITAAAALTSGDNPEVRQQAATKKARQPQPQTLRQKKPIAPKRGVERNEGEVKRERELEPKRRRGKDIRKRNAEESFHLGIKPIVYI